MAGTPQTNHSLIQPPVVHHSIMMRISIILPFIAAALPFYTVEAFAPGSRTSLSLPRVCGGGVEDRYNAVQLRASEEGDDSSLPPLPSQMDAAALKELTASPAASPVEPVSAVSNEVAEEEEETSYPINLPSPVLLGTSMVLAIASTGKQYFVIYLFADVSLEHMSFADQFCAPPSHLFLLFQLYHYTCK